MCTKRTTLPVCTKREWQKRHPFISLKFLKHFMVKASQTFILIYKPYKFYYINILYSLWNGGKFKKKERRTLVRKM